MSIKINRNKCKGCTSCVEVCPGNLIKLNDEKKAVIIHEKDCWGCTGCVKACPAEAISFYLGADLGGRGAFMTVKKHGSLSTWKITLPSGTVKKITVDSSSANKY